MREEALERDASVVVDIGQRRGRIETVEFDRSAENASNLGAQMGVFIHPEFYGHERVLFATDPMSGLWTIIAVHSTALGPAAGGCRMWPYGSQEEALTDVLRLSRGMSYKNAIAGLPMGGGKAVIIGNPVTQKSNALLDGYAQAVNALGGQYVTAEDVGITVSDLERVARHCPYVTGLRATPGYTGGNPSPKTAYGVFLAIKATVRQGLKRNSLRGVRVAIQGVGAVGYELARLLHAEGALLVVADQTHTRAVRAAEQFGAAIVGDQDILFQLVDVIAPCALGGVLSETTIPKLLAPIVCGAANNQLATTADGERLRLRGILYAPDYVVNAGGIISVAAEYLKHLSAGETLARIERIPQTISAIFERARADNRSASDVADDMARAILLDAATS
jgi:leucine dehydrogenase